jgi:hypothetical protein
MNGSSLLVDLKRDLSESIQKLDFLDKTLAQIESKRELFKHIDEVTVGVGVALSLLISCHLDRRT